MSHWLAGHPNCPSPGRLISRGRARAREALVRDRTARLLKGHSVGHRPRVQGHPTIEVASLSIGNDFLLWSNEATTLLAGSGTIVMGDRVFINSGALIYAQNRVEIGDDVAIGLQAVVADSNMHGQEGRPVRHEVTTIGSGSWIGMRSMVLAGVHLGPGCIVAAGAVVTKDFPDDSLIAGVPAKLIRRLEHQEGVHKAWNNDWDPDYWNDGGRASG